jgi:hypothetical protein
MDPGLTNQLLLQNAAQDSFHEMLRSRGIYFALLV